MFNDGPDLNSYKSVCQQRDREDKKLFTELLFIETFMRTVITYEKEIYLKKYKPRSEVF